MLCVADVSDGASSGSEDEGSGKSRGRGQSAERTTRAAPDNHDNPLAALQEKLKELNAAYELVVKNSHQLTKFASDWESGANKPSTGKPMEKFTLLKITSAAVVKVSKPFLALLRTAD